MDDRLSRAISATLMAIKDGQVGALQTPIFLTQEQPDHLGEWVMIDGYLGGQWERGYRSEEVPEYLRRDAPRETYDGAKISLHGSHSDEFRAQLIREGWELTFATQAEQDAATYRAAEAFAKLKIAHDEAIRTGEIDW
jgi:hypothetical protein